MSDSERESYARNQQRVSELEQHKTRIRRLNDLFRRSFAGGLVTLTIGVRTMDAASVSRILTAVRTFDQFTQANDPHDEHDFGSIEEAGERVFWKIDCYDLNLEYGSPDPTDPRVTTRVLTIMLASEY